jgi:pSer/pThr/pTyr-binding forkhead associated (FHA) protein
MSDLKLVFPNGEHGQVLLNDGVTRIGSAEDADVRLAQPGISLQHCELAQSDGQVQLRIATPGSEVSVNGARVDATAVVRPGDLLSFAKVQVRAVGVERASSSPALQRPAAVSDDGATRLRMALPKYVLRGVSGAAFGKTYPVFQQMTIGRQQDCDISIPSEEISRRHASVKPTPDGLMVEDLGSSNGTYINGKRLQSGLLKPGEELRLDAIRFMLIAPGMEIPKASAPAPEAKVAAGGGSALPRIILAVVVLAALGAAAFYLLR